MTMNSDTFRSLVVLSVTNPRKAAQIVAGLGVSRKVLWNVAALVVVLSVILAFFSSSFAPPPADIPPGDYVTPSPFGFALILISSMFVLLVLGYGVGRAFGGTATFDDIFALVIWLQVLLLIANVIQLPLLILLPSVVGLFGVSVMAALFWVLTGFLTQAHGFRSAGLVFLGILGSALILGMIASVVLAICGYVPI